MHNHEGPKHKFSGPDIVIKVTGSIDPHGNRTRTSSYIIYHVLPVEPVFGVAVEG